jgi:hypothetical protein
MTELQKSQPQKPQAPGTPKRPEAKRQDPKTTLSMLKWTTGLSAVALTLAGWGLLARAETVNAASATGLDQTAPASLTLGAAASAKLASLGGPGQAGGAAGLISSAPTGGSARSAAAAAAVVATPPRGAAAATPTDSPTATPTDAPTDVPTGVPTDTPTDVPTAVPTPAPTDTPAVKFKLDVVQWVQNQAGDNIAVVRDNQGILWYVWGDDVPRIEQGLSPQYQPVPVNQFGRSRHS